MNGDPIVTRIKALLLPPPATELRVKSDYETHQMVRASAGCKIDAPGLEEAVAGSPLFVVRPEEDIEPYKEKVAGALNSLKGMVDKSGHGVYVQSSTLGSMEALLTFLHNDCKIPVSGIRIGPIHKKDVVRASVMLEHKKEFAVILAFDVPVAKEAQEYADKVGVRIFTADIIYHLFDQFTAYVEQSSEQQKEAAKDVAVFPCVLKIFEEHIFNTRSPIVVGVRVEEGILRKGTPIVVTTRFGEPMKFDEFIEIGKVHGIEKEHNQLEEANAGEEVAIEIVQSDDKQQYLYGRQFNHLDKLFSKITRESIDSMKQHFADVLKQREIFSLVKKMKKLYNII
jgi:translation initiation factor 5B